MDHNIISSSDFQNKAGLYMEQSAKEPVFITKFSRTVRVLIDIDEYERLKSLDTRQSLYPYELDSEIKAELEKGYQAKPTPELDHLMD